MTGGTYAGFGLRWHSEVPLRRLTALPADDVPADVIVTLTPSIADRNLLRLHPGEKVQRAMDGFRYTAHGEAVLDVYRGATTDRILITPGEQWSGEPPTGFYATVAALLLTLRGAVPLHGSAVEFNGEALLICGPGGAGKSTLAAGLIARGARLISDDLSILHLQPGTGTAILYAGRRTMRLFDATAGYLQQAVPLGETPYLADGKIAVAPPQVDVLRAIPLTRVMLLGDSADIGQAAETKDLLAQQLFRPRWMARLPGQQVRGAILTLAARQLQLLRFQPAAVRSHVTFGEQAACIAKKCLWQ